MQIKENLYNWLCQLKVLVPDGKKYADKVEISKASLTQLESGIAFGVLLREIVKLRNRPQTPLAKLDTLKDNQQKSSILYNWKILCEEYQKIDITIDQDTKALILGGDKEMIHQLLLEIYDKHYRGQQQIQNMSLDDSQLSLGGLGGNTKILATSKISQANQSVDLSKLDPKKDLNKTQNCLEFFIVALAKNLQLSIKQAASLFTNNNKYLAHILAKGVKGVFEPIVAFYKETYANANQLNKLFQEDATKKSLVFAFQALKPGLISKSYEVAYESVRLFTRLGSMIPVQLIREWFLEDQGGLHTALMGVRRHPELVAFHVEMMQQFSRNNFVEVFTTGIRNVLPDTKDFINSVELIFLPLSTNQELLSTGILNDWVTQAIGIAENEFKNAIDTRISSLNFLSEVLGNNELDESLTNTIIALLKKGSRDKSQSLTLMCLNHLFKLLNHFSLQKSNYAPLIYKNLTLSLVENHDNQLVREFILNNFIQIFTSMEAVPISLVLENLIKQLQTSEGVTYIINTFDMQFFMYVSNLNIGIKNAIQLLDFLAKIFLNNLVYQSMSSEIIVNILSKNVENQTMQEFILKFIKISLAMFFASEKKKQGKDPINAQKRNQIVEIIKIIVQFQQQILNEKIKPLVAHTNIQIKQFSKRNSKGMMAILELFGNPERIIEQYEVEYREQQASKLQVPDDEDQFGQLNQRSIGSIKLSKEEQYSLASLKTTKADPKVLEKLETIKKQFDEKAVTEAQKIESYKEAQQKQKNNLRKQLEKRSIEQGVSVTKDRETNLIFKDGSKTAAPQNKHGLTEFEVWDLSLEEDRERYLVEQLFRRYHKIFKYVFFKYANSGNKIVKPQNFQELQEQSNTINEAEFWLFLKEYELVFHVSREQVRALLRSIAIQILKCKTELSSFNYDGFKHLITQYACIIFTKNNKYQQPHKCIEQLLKQMRQVTASKGQTTQLFDDPDCMYFSQSDVIKEFNKKLAEDPKYPLPEGFKSEKEEIIKFNYAFEISDSKTLGYEMLDEILSRSLGIHLIEPLASREYQLVCKPNMLGYVESKVKMNLEKDHYMEQKNKQMRKSASVAQSLQIEPQQPRRNLEIEPFRQYSLGIKLELAKIPFNQAKQRLIVEEVADVLEDMIFAVENKQKTITRKWNIVNKVQKDKIDEKHKEEEEAKQRDEKIQKNHEDAKARLEKLKKERQEKQKQEEELKKTKPDPKKLRQEEKQKEQEQYLKQQKDKIAQKQKEEEKERLEREIKDKKQRAEEIQKKKEAFRKFNEKKIEQYGELFKAEQVKIQMAADERQQLQQQHQKMHEQLYKNIEKKGEQIKVKERSQGEFILKLFRHQNYQGIFTKHNFKLSYLYDLLQLEYYKSIEMVDFKEIPLKLWMWFGERFRVYPDIISQIEFIRVFNAITYRAAQKEKEKQVPTSSLDYDEFLEALFRISIKGYIFFNKLAKSIKEPNKSQIKQEPQEEQQQPPQSIKRTQQTKEFMLNNIKLASNEQEERLKAAQKEIEDRKKMEKEALILDNYQALNDILGSEKTAGQDYNEETLEAFITYLALPNDKTGIELRFRQLIELEAKKKPNKVRKQEASQKLDEEVSQWKEHKLVEQQRQPIFPKKTNNNKSQIKEVDENPILPEEPPQEDNPVEQEN